MNTRRRNKKRAKPDLTNRFVALVIMVIVLITVLATASSYWFVRTTMTQQDLQSLDLSIAKLAATVNAQTEIDQAVKLRIIGQQILQQDRVSRIAVYDLEQRQVWSSQANWPLTAPEFQIIDELGAVSKNDSIVDDDMRRLVASPTVTNLKSVLLSPNQSIVTVSLIRDAENRPAGVIKSMRDYRDLAAVAGLVAKLSFVFLLISCLLVFVISFLLFRRGIRISKGDETILNQQVSQLSELLNKNKQLHRNMKTANSRAVELNERFLRRVGADLHDGPAQQIGYAVLRLNQVSDKQISEELGYEFHTVKQALEESLKEIREISTGLVMPELEQMSLQEGVHKVVERHQINTDTKVKEFYLNLPEKFELPIKICAYRFAQEGLNNATKHGQAKNCRFTAQLVNDVLHLSLKDDGIGFRKSELSTDGGHLGLMGLKDRIESLGGKLSINSELGVGTAIKVSIQMSDLEDNKEITA